MACCNPEKRGILREIQPLPPNYRDFFLTEKFYARHECLNMERTPKVEAYMEQIQKNWDYDARCHYRMPRYQNQTYGWLKGKQIRKLDKCEFNVAANPDVQIQITKLLIRQMEAERKKGTYCGCRKDTNDHWKIV